MNISLLVKVIPKDTESGLYFSIQQFIASAKNRDCDFGVFDYTQCCVSLVGKPRILVDNQEKNIDGLIVKAGFKAKDLESYLPINTIFEESGLVAVNNAKSISITKNKISMLYTLFSSGIPIPKTHIIRSTHDLDNCLKDINTYPIVLKSISGSGGIGVSLVESKRSITSVVDLVLEESGVFPVIIQEFISESSGKDIRAFVVGNEVVTAMERSSAIEWEFRSNFSMGGNVRIIDLTEEEKKLAIKSANVCGLGFAGVDIVRSNNGPKVLEVNANPGMKGIVTATGIDLAGAILDHTISLIKKK